MPERKEGFVIVTLLALSTMIMLTIVGTICVVGGKHYKLYREQQVLAERLAEAFAMDLLQKNRVIVVPGHAFGDMGKRYVRLSFAVSEERIRKGIGRIRAYMEAR